MDYVPSAPPGFIAGHVEEFAGPPVEFWLETSDRSFDPAIS